MMIWLGSDDLDDDFIDGFDKRFVEEFQDDSNGHFGDGFDDDFTWK